LRQELVGDAAFTAIDSKSLFANIERVLDIGVKAVARTNSVLKGGNATLRRKTKFIYYRRDINWDDQAYLIAHELGHLRLDDDLDETINHVHASTVKPTSLTTAVVDSYGARERDELQKNTFGRELLLPRAVAKALFKQGLGPKKIAKALGIPLEVARQQLLDAILLPDYVPPPPQDLPEPTLDQNAAIHAKEKHVHVVAGPGTGKTTTLVHRVKKLIEVDGVSPKKILVLTFTNKAAVELVERLQRSRVKGASEIWAGTFHAFGLEFLRKYYQHFELPQDVTVADKITTITLTATALAGATLEHYRRTDDPYEWLPKVIEAAQRIKEELVTVQDYLEAALVVCEGVKETIYRDVAAVANVYGEVLKEAKLVDFVDLVAIPAKAIASNRSEFNDVADHYDHILVDEFQDMTTAMLSLIEGLSLNAKSLWVVGDIRQAIYHWRGSSLDALLGFSDRFADAKLYVLTQNRRSSDEIIGMTRSVGTHHPLQARLALPKVTGVVGKTGTVPSMGCASSRTEMWNGLTQGIENLRKSGVAYKDQVVLARKGGCVNAAAEALASAGIPTVYIGDIAERDEIKDILSVVQLVVERQPRALLRVGLLSSPPMSLSDVQKIFQTLASNPDLQRMGWLKHAIPGASKNGQLSQLDLRRRIGKFTWSMSPWDFICELVLEQRFLLPDIDDLSLDGHLRRLAVWQFAYMSRVSDGLRKRWTLHRFLNRLRLRQQINDSYVDRQLPPEANALDGVRVLTVHASKGLEFHAVHLCGVHGADFAGGNEPSPLLPPEAINSSPQNYQEESDIECHNLLYVAVSRAKRHLRIFESSDEFPYPFMRAAALQHAISEGVLTSHALASLPKPSVQAPNQHPPQVGRSLVSFDEFRTYDRCPRQYMYRFVMQLGREFAPNSALQARATVIRVLEIMARAGNFRNAITVFYTEWIKARLPEPRLDIQLWEQAWNACERGVSNLAAVNGTHLVALAGLNGMTLELPWGVVVPAPGGYRLHTVGFYPSSAIELDKLKKVVGQMMSCTSTDLARIVEMHMFDLGRNSLLEFHPISVYSRSALNTRTIGILNKEYGVSTSDYACKRCAYAYVCPSLMT
jgi:superfamily I DNA/RNA helicase/Zn-dependent peptidase ImmA (M78 family)